MEHLYPPGWSLHPAVKKQPPDVNGRHTQSVIYVKRPHRVADYLLVPQMENELFSLSLMAFFILNLVLSFLSVSHSLPFSHQAWWSYSQRALWTNPSVGLPPEKLGGCVNASDAYFYTRVCPASDVVYHSLSKGPLFSTSRRMLLYWLLVRQPGSLWRSSWMKLDNFH